MARTNHTLRGICQFFGVLTVLLCVAALAQVKGAGQASAKPHAVSARPDANRAGHVSGNTQQDALAIGPMTAGAPLFLPVVTYDSGGRWASFVAVADVNGDGKLDLIVANCGEECFEGNLNDGSVGVLLGNGDGTFQPAVTYNSGGHTPRFVVVTDVNGDGKLDLVVANWCGNNGCLSEALVTVLLGNGDGTFQAAVGYGAGGLFVSSVAVADVNGDGNPDLLVANDCADSSCDGSVAVLLGNGNGTFQVAVPYSTGGKEAFSLAVADVNGDGRPDLLVATDVFGCSPTPCTDSSVGVLLGNGDGSFQPAATYFSGAYGWGSVAVADVNGDGKLDLVAENNASRGSANGAVSVLLGNGDGTFQTVVTYKSSAGGWGTSAAVADVNGDGKPDLVVTDQCAVANCLNDGLVGVLLNNGRGMFYQPVTYDAGGFLTNWVAVADANNDGRPDLIVANQCADNTTFCTHGSLGVLLNNPAFENIPPSITISATPKRLWPPDGRVVPVTISGTITDSGSGVNPISTVFAVHDEYHLVQPNGTISLDSAGNYSFTVLLQASRADNDLDGRRYSVGVRARDNDGNRSSKSTTITVPHELHRTEADRQNDRRVSGLQF